MVHFQVGRSQVILDGPAADVSGQLPTFFGPVCVTSLKHGQQLPELHLGPCPYYMSDRVDAVHLLQLPRPVVGWSRQPCAK